MQLRAPLMKEHRLIERMLSSLQNEITAIESSRRVDPGTIDVAVDFIRTYADRTHHGKEEDILFAALDERGLSAEDRRAMEDLVADHAFARVATTRLAEANARYRAGEDATLAEVLDQLRTLCEFYPRHIAKEDKAFFPAARAYLSEDEEQAILARFWEFDRMMIHEKYRAVVQALRPDARDTP
jgi:hemerythrin-like domain-containing protein